MREIEVKARLGDKPTLIQAAEQLGITFSDPYTQDDIVYETTLPKTDPNWNVFRIRKQDGKAILTMKYKASSRSHDNHERESVIENTDEVADMLARVGYMPSLHIKKTRQTAAHNGLELCVDEVDELGAFVEVEKLVDDNADVDAVQAELWLLLQSLGVAVEDRVHKGYDVLMHEYLGRA